MENNLYGYLTVMDSFFVFFFSLLFVLTISYMLTLGFLRRGLRRCVSKTVVLEPVVSIVVSMHNEENNARECIERLVQQSYPANKMEIIIINDRSTDRTPQILAECQRIYGWICIITIETVPEGIAPKKNAISQAISHARGEIILLTDADGRPPVTWVRQIVSLFEEKTGMVIGYAPYKNDEPCQSVPFRLLSLEYLSHAAIAAATTCLGYPLTCVGTNMAYRKKVFQQLSGFGIHCSVYSGDDDLFLQRVREETDWQIRYCPEAAAQVWNAPPADWRQFFHQRLRYASKGFLYPPRISLILILFYVLNLFFILAPWSLLSSSHYLSLLILAFAIKGGAEFLFLTEAADYLQDRRHLALFPIAFFLHIPYVLVFGLLSQLKSFEWANRKSR
jgi:cellulose synthase/poly-beta-1,6-N-acetylglucosamine synthase-like glycosyltransferase